MPFDGGKNQARLNREVLIADLRSPEEWKDFYWDFGVVHSLVADYVFPCGTIGCAVGRGIELGLVPNLWSPVYQETIPEEIELVAEVFGLSTGNAHQIFWSMSFYHSRVVTPAMVADALEAAPYVDEQEVQVPVPTCASPF